jgi:tripartite-type tricarboxylate transporter receptor subunit TctC
MRQSTPREQALLVLVALCIAVGLCWVTSIGFAAEQKPFFQDKIIRIVVATVPGGGFDTYSRAIARHWGKHIPGNPRVIIENMPGGGMIIGAKHVSQSAPDGLTIGNFISDLALGQLVGLPGIDFDMRKFEWVGVPVKDSIVCALTKASGITSIEKWKASLSPVKLGGTGRLVITDNTALILKEVVGLPVHLVSGYKGTAPIRLAAESGELAGGCWQWESIKATWRSGLQAGEVNIVLQMTPEPLPELPNVPLALTLVRSAEALKLITAPLHTTPAITRLYALPPGTPKERVTLLRHSFMETMKDPEFLAEAKKSKLEVDPTGGEEVEKAIRSLFQLEPPLLAKMKKILLGN